MKRLLVASALCLALTVSKPALAADRIGLYVAPKFFASQQNSDKFGAQDNFPTATMRDSSGYRKHQSDTVVGGGLAVGYDFRPSFSLPIRAELEYAAHGQARFARSGFTNLGYTTSTVNRKASVSTLFANVFYDIDTGTRFTPYVGAGIGMAHIRVKDSFMLPTVPLGASASKTVDNFAWNLGVGVAYSFDDNWSADLGLRYSSFGKVTGAVAVNGYSFQAKDRASSEEVLLGLRYGF